MTLTEALEFVRIWYESADQDEAARRLGIDRRQLQNRAAGLRRSHQVRLDSLPGRSGGGTKTKNSIRREEKAELRRWAEACRAAKAMRRYRGAS